MRRADFISKSVQMPLAAMRWLVTILSALPGRVSEPLPSWKEITSGLRILVAEDLPDSAEILKPAFSRAGVSVPLHFVRECPDCLPDNNGPAVQMRLGNDSSL